MFLELLDKNPHPPFIGENPTGVYVAVSWVRSRSSRLSGNASLCALRDDLNNSKEGDSGNLRQQLKKIRFIYLYRRKNRCGQGSRSQGLNGRQALLGALKQVLLRERKAQEEGKEKSSSSRVSRASHARPLVPPKRGLCRP